MSQRGESWGEGVGRPFEGKERLARAGNATPEVPGRGLREKSFGGTANPRTFRLRMIRIELH